MENTPTHQIAQLQDLTTAQLHAKYAEAFGELPRSRHRAYLLKRIAWRLQALAEGDLSERARRRAAELANDADVRIFAPTSLAGAAAATQGAARRPSSQYRLPPASTVLSRLYKGRMLEVTVLARGFQYEGRLYKSLSAVAKSITGRHWNGFHFFGLWKQTPRRPTDEN